MAWTSRYTPPVKNPWHGRPDAPDRSCFFQIIEFLDLAKPSKIKPPAIALIGFSCDEGVRRNLGRPGAAEGPQAIRELLAKMPVQKQIACYDAGDITCTDGDLEASQQALADAIAILLKNHITPIVLGGGHEISWGHYQGINKQYPRENLGIINFDAHFDMRPLLTDNKGSSGTPFLQIAKSHQQAKRRFDYNCVGIQRAANIRQIFETAKEYNAQFISADDLHHGYMEKASNFVDRIITLNKMVYLSVCLDVFASPYAPGVSAPQALGLTPWQVLPLIRHLAASGKVVSYDIAELAPAFDRDQRTAKLAANLVYEMIHHHAFTSIGPDNGNNVTA